MKIELLAPAGSLHKLKVACLYGADAVYVGGKDFSLRAYADNFSEEELAEGVAYAHALRKKIYVTVNIFPKNADFPIAERYFKLLEGLGVDGALVTDPGFFALARRVAPSLPLHLSTQANTLNAYTVEFWAKQGIARVVLARELSLAEIAEIHSHNPQVELEAFVHGAMCVSYSGRCLLSNYLASRDANRGECVQACRWNYTLGESSRPGQPLGIEEDERGSYILNSKDLNMLSEIGALAESGVVSFKIEGRMKSEYYLATVINAYRRAIDAYLAGKLDAVKAELEAELTKVVHREYTKAYFCGQNPQTISYDEGQNAGTHEFIGVVTGAEEGFATVEMRNRFRTGEVLEVLSPGAAFNRTFTVGKMYNAEGEIVEDAKIVQEILRVEVPFALAEGDILRRERR